MRLHRMPRSWTTHTQVPLRYGPAATSNVNATHPRTIMKVSNIWIVKVRNSLLRHGRRWYLVKIQAQNKFRGSFTTSNRETTTAACCSQTLRIHSASATIDTRQLSNVIGSSIPRLPILPIRQNFVGSLENFDKFFSSSFLVWTTSMAAIARAPLIRFYAN